MTVNYLRNTLYHGITLDESLSVNTAIKEYPAPRNYLIRIYVLAAVNEHLVPRNYFRRAHLSDGGCRGTPCNS
jgi:hypothetical protein